MSGDPLTRAFSLKPRLSNIVAAALAATSLGFFALWDGPFAARSSGPIVLAVGPISH